MYLVINLTIADMFVGGFSHFSLFVTLLYLSDIVQFPHLTLELTLTTGFLFIWFPLKSLTNIAVISLDQMHAAIRPYTALRHRLIKKWIYGVTIAALVWVLPAMFIILILKNRMFNQSPIFSTSSGPSVFSWNSCSKKHILSRDFYSSKKVKNSWMNVSFISVFRSFQSINFYDWSWEWDFHFSLVFPYLVIIRKNGLLIINFGQRKVTERCTSENVVMSFLYI